MLALVKSATPMGVDAVLVDVEVDMSLGMPFFNVVGLPEGAAKESKVRVMSALKNCDFTLPQKRITVNLAPADLRKEGPAFELPIALGVLCAAQLIEPGCLDGWLFAGELSLDGVLKPVRGVLPMAIAARDGGYKGVMVPAENAPEAALVDGVTVIAVRGLLEAVRHVSGDHVLAPFSRRGAAGHDAPDASALDMAEVRGQSEVKAALELAAAGGHHVLLSGPPGSGKTMLARRVPTILPAMTPAEALEVTKVYSVVGLVGSDDGLVSRRPFRAPHHTISDAGLVGGGPLARPGELSLAHRGVLFLDELPEFRRNVLEVLRQPLEEGQVRLARAAQHVTYPCQVMLVAAMNPCPCGYYKVDGRVCTCMPQRVSEYHTRISGPLLDRIDVTLQTRAVELESLARSPSLERPSAYYRARVEAARERQAHRLRGEGQVCNAEMTPAQTLRHCVASRAAWVALRRAVKEHGFTGRAHDRVLRMARTRADLEGHERIEEEDMAVAIGCRVLDRLGYRALSHPGPAVRASPWAP